MEKFKLRTKRNYQVVNVDYGKIRKSFTIPDQAMTIAEIVKRFVKGIPVDINQRQGVFCDQSEFDLEAISRMSFADKAALSDDLRLRAEKYASMLKKLEDERKEDEADEKDAGVTKPKAKDVHSSKLDNTMLDDTKAKPGV